MDPGWKHDTGLFIAKPATPGALRDFSIIVTVKIEGKGEVGGGGFGGRAAGRPGVGGWGGGLKACPLHSAGSGTHSVQQQSRRHR